DGGRLSCFVTPSEPVLAPQRAKSAPLAHGSDGGHPASGLKKACRPWPSGSRSWGRRGRSRQPHLASATSPAPAERQASCSIPQSSRKHGSGLPWLMRGGGSWTMTRFSQLFLIWVNWGGIRPPRCEVVQLAQGLEAE